MLAFICFHFHLKGAGIGKVVSYHFLPEETVNHDGAAIGGGAFVSAVTSAGADESSSEASRRKLQELFLLPTDRPIFRPGNAYAFEEDVARSPYLRNVHLGLKNPLPHAENPSVGIVQGNYIYHHYLQVRGNYCCFFFQIAFAP